MVQESAVEGKRRLREMEGKLQCDRKEMNRLIQEENGLIVELPGCRDLLESARMQCDTLQYEYECRLKEQTELHGAELEKVRNTKQCARVDRRCDAIPYRDKTVEATLAQLSQEKMTLQEENAGVSAENERLAKQCVDLERAAKDAVDRGEGSRGGGALEQARHRTEVLEREKAEVKASICEVWERMAVISSAEERMQGASGKEVMAEKESMEWQLQSVLVELEQLQSRNTFCCHFEKM